MSVPFFSFCQQYKRLFAIFLTLICVLYPGQSFSKDGPDIKNKVRVVVIDAGHGGKDPGAVGKKTKEKDINLSVALMVGNYIESNFEDVTVIYTRKDDTFVGLNERAKIANKNKADLFISIHANASPNVRAYGSETFVMGASKSSSNFEVAKLENSVITLEEDYSTKYEGFDPTNTESYIIFSFLQHTYREQSLNMASHIQNQFRDRAGRSDRGVKQAEFLVLWQTTMPSVLVELGFISNAEEEKYLASKQGQEHLASAIYRAFKEYKSVIESSSNFEAISPLRIEEPLKQEVVYFKVQLFSTQKKVLLNDKIFNNLDEPEEFVSGKWNKYAVGSFNSYEDASVYCNSIQNKFKGAFVIAVKAGQIVSVNDAISELNSNNR
jgi:N-acetylmuramoyl-L-alanine amidase